MMVKSPVAWIVFNRPQHAARTFEVLRQQQPSRLFIIADGPRPGHATDAERCAAVRKIAEQVDWPCEVSRNYAAANLGLKNRVSSGLDWVFDAVERAIILEDDCLPHPDFFRFCDDLLEYYADDERVSVITGNNFQHGRRRGEAAYYFSKYNHCWGWASWRREWRRYQGDIPFWPQWRHSEQWRRLTPDAVERRYYEEIFDLVRADGIDTWDYQWTASIWRYGGLTATPNVNLVSNIGFDADATHTHDPGEACAALPVAALGELTHPPDVVHDVAADRHVFDHLFGGKRMRLPRSLLRLPRRMIRAVLAQTLALAGRNSK